MSNDMRTLLASIEATPEHSDLLSSISLGFRNARNFGADIFEWFVQDFDLSFEPTPLYLLLRHAIELLDAMAILVERGSIDPCWLMARSLFEVSLQVEYLIAEPNSSYDRSVAYLTCTLLDLKRHNDRLFEGGSLQVAVTNHPRIDGVTVPKWLVEYSTTTSKHIDMLLNQEPFCATVRKYKEHKRSPSWYALDGGPTNLFALAQHLQREAEYLTFYPEASRAAHGNIPLGNPITIPFGYEGIALSSIRNPLQIVPVVSHGFYYTRSIFECFLPYLASTRREEFERWLAAEFSPFLEKLGKLAEDIAGVGILVRTIPSTST
ncbi:MAG: DUF5677 domain-containing protein [Candidatus Kapaibacterium sp.]